MSERISIAELREEVTATVRAREQKPDGTWMPVVTPEALLALVEAVQAAYRHRQKHPSRKAWIDSKLALDAALAKFAFGAGDTETAT